MSIPSVLRDRLIHPFGRALLNSANRALSHASPIERRAIYSPAEFPWTQILEKEYPNILTELRTLLKDVDYIPEFSDLSRDQSHLAGRDSGERSSFWLMASGRGKMPRAALKR